MHFISCFSVVERVVLVGEVSPRSEGVLDDVDEDRGKDPGSELIG